MKSGIALVIRFGLKGEEIDINARIFANDMPLRVVEDLSYQFSDNVPANWTRTLSKKARERFLEELLRERDAFIYANEEILIDTLQDGGLTIVEDAESLAATA